MSRQNTARPTTYAEELDLAVTRFLAHEKYRGGTTTVTVHTDGLSLYVDGGTIAHRWQDGAREYVVNMISPAPAFIRDAQAEVTARIGSRKVWPVALSLGPPPDPEDLRKRAEYERQNPDVVPVAKLGTLDV